MPSINLSNIKRKFLENADNQTRGCWVRSENAIHCAMRSPSHSEGFVMFRVNQSSSSLHSWNFDNLVIQTWQNGQKLLEWFWDKNLDQVCSELNASDNLCIRKRNGGAIFRSAVKLQKRTSFNFWWNQVPLLSKFFIFVQLKQLSRAQERFEKECNWCIASKLPELMHFSLSPTPSLSASLMCVCPSLSFSDYLIPSVCLCVYMCVCLALLLLFSLYVSACMGAWVHGCVILSN